MRLAALNIEDNFIRTSIITTKLGSTQEAGVDDIKLSGTDEERSEILFNHLQKLKESDSITSVTLGLESSLFTHHIVSLPVSTHDDISNALAFELEQYLPLPPDEYIFDFHTLSTSKEGSKNLVMAIRKEKLSWITSAITTAELELKSIRCSAIEALNEFIVTRNTLDCTFIYHGHESYSIINIKNSTVQDFNLARVDNHTDVELQEYIKSSDGEAFIVGAKGTAPPTTIKTSALTFQMPNLIGMASIKTRPISMDFTPYEFRRLKKNFIPHAIVALGTLCVILFFMTSILAYYKDYSALSTIRTRLNEIKTTSREVVEIKKEIEELQKRKLFLNEFQSKRNRNILVVRQLSKLLPPDAWLTSLSANEKDKVEIHGYAKRSADIIAPLEKSKYFKNVGFSSPVTVREGTERFSISMEVQQ